MEPSSVNQLFAAFCLVVATLLLFRFAASIYLYSEEERNNILEQAAKLTERIRNEDD
jgi:hypothetical protein